MTLRSILVTGGSGFVGGALIARLLATEQFSVIAPTRVALPDAPRLIQVPTPIFSGHTQWGVALGHSVEVVIHCAARVHVMDDASLDPLGEFRKVNVEATLNLARQAAAAGVKRFVFLSSIKVNGESTEPAHAFTPDDFGPPTDPYGLSKYEAEQQLLALAAQSQMEVVIVRPVLVYGPGVKANFRSMMEWLVKGVPLPLGAVHNKRSLVSVFNLVDLIMCCIDHPDAANQVFLVSDGEDVSTPQLLSKLGTHLGKKPLLLPIPSWALYLAASTLGKRAVAERVCGSLQVDISKTRRMLGWAPVVSLDDALHKTATAFLEHRA